MYHNPVLLQTSIDGLNIRPDGTYVDVTFGGGGHSARILEQLNENGRLIAFDQDPDAARNALQDNRFQFVPYNFCHLKKFLQYYQAYPVDAILADLGVSSFQFDTPERGFSHRFDGELDMRMNRNKGLSAAQIINEYPVQKLADIFRQYGELPNARQIALHIDKARETKITSTAQLVDILTPLLPHNKENKTLSQIFPPHRSEQRTRRAPRFPVANRRRAQARRTSRHHLLSLLGRPTCEELHEIRQFRREYRKGLLRQPAHPVQPHHKKSNRPR